MGIRVVIVDDHELVRAGIKALLMEEPDLQVVGEAGDGGTGLATCRALAPDVVVLDLRLPDTSGVEVCTALHKEFPDMGVLILSTFTEGDLVLASLRAGARGFLVKDVQSMDLKRNIRAVARGEVVIDPKVAHHLVREVRDPDREEEKAPLNEQQLAIVRLVAQGFTNREIAGQLFLSEKTVKAYLAEALRKLNVKNRVEAAMFASKRGWI